MGLAKRAAGSLKIVFPFKKKMTVCLWNHLSHELFLELQGCLAASANGIRTS